MKWWSTTAATTSTNVNVNFNGIHGNFGITFKCNKKSNFERRRKKFEASTHHSTSHNRFHNKISFNEKWIRTKWLAGARLRHSLRCKKHRRMARKCISHRKRFILVKRNISFFRFLSPCRMFQWFCHRLAAAIWRKVNDNETHRQSPTSRSNRCVSSWKQPEMTMCAVCTMHMTRLAFWFFGGFVCASLQSASTCTRARVLLYVSTTMRENRVASTTLGNNKMYLRCDCCRLEPNKCLHFVPVNFAICSRLAVANPKKSCYTHTHT